MNNNLTVCRPVGGLYVSKEILKLTKQPKYDFDVLIANFGFLVERGEHITIFDLIERVRKYSDNFKTKLLCDSVEWQANEILVKNKVKTK